MRSSARLLIESTGIYVIRDSKHDVKPCKVGIEKDKLSMNRSFVETVAPNHLPLMQFHANDLLLLTLLFLGQSIFRRAYTTAPNIQNRTISRSRNLTLTHMICLIFQRILEVNTLGAIRITQRFLPLLRRSQGRLVMISSLAGKLVYPGLIAYCMSKHALVAVSDGLRQELRKWNISGRNSLKPSTLRVKTTTILIKIIW